MPALPDGDPVPGSGELPAQALARLGEQPFGVYVHVPFCAVRCGYCDFNTYTASELAGAASPQSYLAAALTEVRLARRALGADAPPVDTVFVGGGTPTLLSAEDLRELLGAVEEAFGLVPGAEVTTEANPESVDGRSLAALREAGFTRVSFGMQSAVPHVLAALDRRHTPGRVRDAVGWARAAGFTSVSLDLIYGAPGESASDWQASLDAAVSLEPDHVSAYALVVEEGTRLAAQVRRGEVTAPDEDEQADKYLAAEAMLAGSGFGWYEVSNWALGEAQRSRHNLGYWRGADWWGVGPGAHSHVGGVRWWNVKHPAEYARRLAEGRSPGAGREVLDAATRAAEEVLLGVRLAEGLPVAALDRATGGPAGRDRAATLATDGLLDADALARGAVVLTLRGRLLADLVVRQLVDPVR